MPVPDLPAEVRRRIVVGWGDEVQGWLEAVLLIAARRARAWHLDLDTTIVGGFDSWVLTCSDDRGHRRILKLIPDGRIARAQAETLRAWERLGASRCVGLVAFDEVGNAILLERVEPGVDGTMLTDARRATREAAAILTDLQRPQPEGIDLPSLADKVAGDLVYIRERLERSAITKAEELVSDLLESASASPVILHADFSLRNMLDAGARGFRRDRSLGCGRRARLRRCHVGGRASTHAHRRACIGSRRVTRARRRPRPRLDSCARSARRRPGRGI